MKGRLITFEGTEGVGKSTQIELLARRLREIGHTVRLLREPGGTAIGEEIRHTLKESAQNHAMTPEAELLLMNASRAQLVREIIRPALAAGEIVLCDRYHDSTTAYQGHGRQLDLKWVRAVLNFAIGSTRPDLTILLMASISVSEARRKLRGQSRPAKRDRFEEADRAFFARVEKGYRAIARLEPKRIRMLDATRPVAEIEADIWQVVKPLISARRKT
jgi:dTMP kinase